MFYFPFYFFFSILRPSVEFGRKDGYVEGYNIIMTLKIYCRVI